MNLQRVFDKLIKAKVIPRFRASHVKTSLRRYATALGYTDIASCPQAAYNIAAKERWRLIENKVRRSARKGEGRELSPRTLANTRCDVNLVLRQAASLGLIGTKHHRPGPSPTAAAPTHKYSGSHIEFGRGESEHLPTIAIREAKLSPRLREELDAYQEWATAEFVPDRPRTRKRRLISALCDREILRRVAGFHVKYCGAVVADLSLQALTDERVACKYVNWFIEHHGTVTQTLKQVLISLLSLADYLMFTAGDEQRHAAMAEASRRLKGMINRLPDCVAVRDKKKRWLSLKQINLCAVNRYPRNEARLAVVSPAVRQKLLTLNTKGQHSNLKHAAVHAMESLLVRLMCQVPLRLRNFCEMSWNPHNPEEGKNLFRKDGSWFLRFSGSELKVGSRWGKINAVQHRVPPELTWLVEEVLTIWRPIITEVSYQFPEEGKGKRWNYKEPPQTSAPKYKRAPQDVLVFLIASCNPASRDALRFWVKSTTYAYSGVAVNPHLIRDIWATEYIKSTGDFVGAAKRLGNSVQVVMKHYAHLFDEDVEQRGDAFNRSIFNEQEKE